MGSELQASKAGLAGFTEALRFELASRFGIDVCGVYPAYVDTPTYRNSANYTLELYVRLSVVGVHLSTVPDGGLGEAPTPRRRIAILRELRHDGVIGSYFGAGYLPADVEKRPQKSTV